MSDYPLNGNGCETRFVRCDDCHGEGVIEYGHPNAPDAAGVEPCACCYGTGLMEVEVEPVSLDDIAEFAEMESR